MFRRFRYKDADGQWQRKWKKRVIDHETGKVTWQDYDRDSYKDQWTGRGYYKSAAANAMRLTRTETNIAYRRADNLRWRQMDFVLGQEIQLSHNHPEPDICDDLKGRYPKDFVFDGWHPQCFCRAVPILIDDDELERQADAWDEGRDYTPKARPVTEMPPAFKRWVKANRDDIERAARKGRAPYFIRNNAAIVDDILGNKRPLTTLEKAAQRHKARTDEQAEAIKLAWAKRVKRNSAIKLNADGIAKLASDFGEAPSLAALRKAIADGDLTAMQAETRTVGRAIASIRKQEKALGDLIPDAHKWHKQFTMAELQSAHKAVESKLSQIWGSLDDEAQVIKMQKALSFEIQWMGSKGRKYKTWEVAQEAYRRKLAVVDHRAEMFKIRGAIKGDLATLQASTGKKAKDMLADFDKLFADPGADLAALRAKAGDITKKAKALRKAAQTRAAKANKASASNNVSTFMPKSDAETRDDFVKWARSQGISVNPADVVVDKGFIRLQGSQHEDIYKALKPETASEHYQLWNHRGVPSRWGASGYIQTGNSFMINKDFRETGLEGPINAAAEKILRGHGALPDDIKTIKLLDKKIAEFSLPIPLRVTRYVDTQALPIIFRDGSIKGRDCKALKLAIDKSNKTVYPDPAFLSASTNQKQNVFTGYGVKMEIEVPPGTPMYFSNNYLESEVVLGRGTEMELLSYKTAGSKLILRLRVLR